MSSASGFEANECTFYERFVVSSIQSKLLTEVAKNGKLTVEGHMIYGESSKQSTQDTFGAHSVEMVIHKHLRNQYPAHAGGLPTTDESRNRP